MINQVNTSTQIIKSFPSISELFKESWLSFKKSALSLFILFLISIALFAIPVILLLVAAFSFGLFAALGSITTKTDPSLIFSKIPPSAYAILAVLGVVFILLCIVIGLAIQIASIIIIHDSDKQISVGSALKRSFSLIVPLYLTTIISTFLAFGSFFLFVFPAFFISFLFSFVMYEIILGNKKFLQAIKGSYQIITQNFWNVLGRAILLVALYMLFYIVCFLIGGSMGASSIILDKSSSLSTGKDIIDISRLVGWILGSLFVWFGLSYSINLYKQASAATDRNKPVSIKWIWIVSIIGWIITALVYVLVIGLIIKQSKNILNNHKKAAKYENEIKEEKEKILSYAPSECGMSIPVLDTTDTYQGKTRKWTFEELELTPESFLVLDPNTYPIKKAYGSFLFYKDSEELLKNYKQLPVYSGLGIYCIDNTKLLTLEEFKTLVLMNKNFKTEVKNPVQREGLDLEYVVLKDNKSEKPYTTPVYLGVNKKLNKLIVIRFIAPPIDDPLREKLNNDQNIIYRNIKIKDVDSNK